MKNATGYDLAHLIVGSEGTLGIVAKAWIKLLPLQKFRVDLLALFPTMQLPIDAVPKIMAESGTMPTAVEFMDSMLIKADESYLNSTLLREDMDDETWEATKEAALKALHAATYRHGGNLSGEHGIVSKRREEMQQLVDPVELDMTKAIKKALAPNLVLNLGKIVSL